MQKIGYARVSTDLQNLDSQIDALTTAGCQLIFEENESGTKRARPELDKVLAVLNPGDSLVIFKLDRLSRSLKDLINITESLDKRGIHLVITTLSIDTSTAIGRMMLQILGAVAEVEAAQIRERTKAGLESARESGKTLGRPSKIDSLAATTARTLIESGMSKENVCKQLGFKRATLYRALATAS